MRVHKDFAAVGRAFEDMSRKLFAGIPTKPYPAHVRGLYRALFDVAESARGHFSNVGIGRKIWGSRSTAVLAGKKSNLDTFVHPTKLEGNLVAGIMAVGIPAMIEKGGRTKPHAIYPWRSGAKFVTSRKLGLQELGRFTVRRGRKTLVGGGALKLKGGQYVRWVKHHSAQIPKRPTIRPLLERAESLLRRYMERGLGADVERMV